MCIFCDIIAGKIPGSVIYEDEDVVAFLDISQVTKGHTLVVPKQHFDNFLVCEEAVMMKVMKTAQTVGNHVMEVLNAKGMNVLSNVHEIAGQSVNHFHVHLIPRYGEDDAVNIEFKESETQDLNAISALLKM